MSDSNEKPLRYTADAISGRIFCNGAEIQPSDLLALLNEHATPLAENEQLKHQRDQATAHSLTMAARLNECGREMDQLTQERDTAVLKSAGQVRMQVYGEAVNRVLDLEREVQSFRTALRSIEMECVGVAELRHPQRDPIHEIARIVQAAQAGTSPAPARNFEVLESFTEYCRVNPEQRFWQALRNWCGERAIVACSWKDLCDLPAGMVDTFSREGISANGAPAPEEKA